MESFLLKRKTKKTYLDAISTFAYSSQASYRAVLNRLDEFCEQNYKGRTTEEIIAELKTLTTDERDEAYFGVLQDYVNWLLRRNLSHKTVNNHFKVANQYFSYHGIRAHPMDLRQNVRRPREIKEKLHPLTLQEIHRVFLFSDGKRRMLYLTLIGSGMRIRECVSLRRRDFDLTYAKRIKIDIPAQNTKTQTAHTTFVTQEAAKYLVPRLRSLGPDDLVFATNPNPYHASMTESKDFQEHGRRHL